MPTTEPNPANGCPKCGGELWDNRATKKSPRAPDYKCKNAPKTQGGPGCDGVIWPPKNGAPAPTAAAPAASTKVAHTSGPFVAGIDAPNLDLLFGLYSACVDHVLAVEVPKLMKADIGVSPESVSSMAATLVIQASK